MRTFALVLVLWLTLNETVAPGPIVLGSLIALGASLAFARLHPARRGARRPRAIVGLLGSLVADVVKSNVEVAAIVLGLNRRNRVAGFLEMPLKVRTPEALAAMACIVTATPGTSWARYDREAHRVTIHVLDLVDPDEWVRGFKARYERRLMEIFE